MNRMHQDPEQGRTLGIRGFANKFKVLMFSRVFLLLLRVRLIMEERLSSRLPALFCFARSEANDGAQTTSLSRLTNTARFIFNDLLQCRYSGLPSLKDPEPLSSPPEPPSRASVYSHKLDGFLKALLIISEVNAGSIFLHLRGPSFPPRP